MNTHADGEPERGCDYCGLPVLGGQGDADVVYCCYGCRFAAAVTQDRGDAGANHWTAATLGISVFLSMNVVMLTMALWSYTGNLQSPFEIALANFLRYGALLFAAPVWLLLGRPLAIQAWEQLRRGSLSTDLLLLTGVVAANLFSVVSTWRGAGHVYYEVGCVILVLVTLGRWLEATGRVQATQALDQLERLIPDTVRLVDPHSGESVIPRGSATIGQVLHILAGERIPFDGRLLRGRAVIDEQFFTGESVPSEKRNGDPVLGGSLNLDGDIWIEITAAPHAGALGRLVEAVRKARMAKGHYQQLADRWSSYFFPVITIVAAGTWFYHGMHSGWESGLLNALSVVLISCPCALALATPLAVWVALATAASHGVLFRSGDALERLANVRALRWDKTGTLTTGLPRLLAIHCESDAEQALVEILANQLTVASNHPYSLAIQEAFNESSETCDAAPIAADVQTQSGQGLLTTHPTLGTIVLGSERRLQDCHMGCGPKLRGLLENPSFHQYPLTLIGWKGQVRGVFFFEESLRPEAFAALQLCRDRKLDLAVLTGDRPARGAWLQRLLHIPVLAGLLPEEKLAAIRLAQQQAGSVAMIGDGLNDAPAMAAADVGIAMGCGADVTRDSADLCLMSNDLRLVPWAILYSQRAVRTIRQNLFWSFGYNTVGVLIAALGWLHPAVAAIVMVGSSVMVLGNSLRLREDNSPQEGDLTENQSHAFLKLNQLSENSASKVESPR